MKNQLIALAFVGLFACFCAPVSGQSSLEEQLKALSQIDSIQKAFKWQTGKIELENGLASLTVPAGFRYLPSDQSRFVIEKIWGNPANRTSLGMIFPENVGPLDSNMFAFNLSFDQMGYVKDDDADKIDYTDLLANMKKDIGESNKTRAEAGYETLELIGWASQPFYDKQKKVLHWAKELRFGESPINTLNYDVRALGRKGVLSMNAIGTMGELPLVKQNIDALVAGVQFSDGNRYADFDPKVDEVAAWTIGGLVAGKVLAKTGFFVLLLKFIKPILLALVAFGSMIWKFFSRKKEDEEQAYFEQPAPETPTDEQKTQA